MEPIPPQSRPPDLSSAKECWAAPEEDPEVPRPHEHAGGIRGATFHETLWPHASRADVQKIFLDAGIDPSRVASDAVFVKLLQNKLSGTLQWPQETLQTALRLATWSCPAKNKALGLEEQESAEATPHAQDTTVVTVESFRQALLLGTEQHAQQLCDRMECRDPSKGLWVDRAELVAFLDSYLESRRAFWAVPASFLSFIALIISAFSYYRVNVAHEVTSVASESLDASDIVAASKRGYLSLEAALWDWLAGRSEIDALSANLLSIGGVRLTHVHGVVDTCDEHFWVIIGHVLKDHGGPFMSKCSGEQSPHFWHHSALRSSDAQLRISATRESWRRNSTALELGGLTVETLAHNSAAKFYVLYELNMTLDLSGLSSAELKVSAFDAKPAWFDFQDDFNNGKAPQLIADSILACVLVLLGMQALGRLCRRCCIRKGGLKDFKLCCLDVVLFLIGFVFASLRAYSSYLIYGLNELVGKLPNLERQSRYTLDEFLSAVDSSGSSLKTYEDELDAAVGQARQVVESQAEQYSCMAALMTCLCLRLLWSLSGVRVFSRLVGSLVWATRDLLCLILLVSVVLCPSLAMISHISLGARFEEFYSVDSALGQIYLVLWGRSAYGLEVQRAYNSVIDTRHGTVSIIGILSTALVVVFNCVVFAALPGIFVAIIVRTYANARMIPSSAQSAQFREISDSQCTAEWLNSLRGHLDDNPLAPNADAAHSREIARKKLCEQRIFEQLVHSGVHPDTHVSSASLAEALGAQNWADREQVHSIINSALLASTTSRSAFHNRTNEMQLAQTTNPASACLRLCARADANVRELSERLAPFQYQLKEKGPFMVPEADVKDARTPTEEWSSKTAVDDGHPKPITATEPDVAADAPLKDNFVSGRDVAADAHMKDTAGDRTVAKAAFLEARNRPLFDLQDAEVQMETLLANEYTEITARLFLAGDYNPQTVVYLDGTVEKTAPNLGLVVQCSENPSNCAEANNAPFFKFEPREDSEGRVCVGIHCFDVETKNDLLKLKDCCIQIKAKLEQQCNVLVHCQQGVSATVVAAFCMMYFDISTTDASESLRRLRPACTEQVQRCEELLRTNESRIRQFSDSIDEPASVGPSLLRTVSKTSTCSEPDLDVQDVDVPPAPLPEDEGPPPPPPPPIEEVKLPDKSEMQTSVNHLLSIKRQFEEHDANILKRHEDLRKAIKSIEQRIFRMYSTQEAERQVASVQLRQLDNIEEIIDGFTKGTDPVFTKIMTDLAVTNID